jgi:hypothetical protein
MIVSADALKLIEEFTLGVDGEHSSKKQGRAMYARYRGLLKTYRCVGRATT